MFGSMMARTEDRARQDSNLRGAFAFVYIEEETSPNHIPYVSDIHAQSNVPLFSLSPSPSFHTPPPHSPAHTPRPTPPTPRRHART